MSNRKSTPLVGDAFSVWWPSRLGHTMVLGRTGTGKTVYDAFRLTTEEFRLVRGERDAPEAGDDACA